MPRRLLGRLILPTVAPLVALAVIFLSAGAASAAFPGLNGKIAYSHQVDMSSAAIFTSNPDGSSPKDLSAVGGGGGPTADFQPAWSASGKQLAFVRVDMQHCSGQIWTMSADGTGQANRSNDGASADEFNPAYGPDGSILFVRAPAGSFNICSNNPVTQGDIWVMRPNGSKHQLTKSGKDNLPAWSPDGKKIAFTQLAPGGPHIFVINANGSGTPKDLGPGLKPNWSPDGKRIAFAAPSTQGPNGPTGGPVTVMNADGTHRRTLNTNATAPAWSPDGTEITYVGFVGQGSVIGVMDANGHNQHTVTNPGSGNSDVKPDWQQVQGTLHLSVRPGAALAGQRTCFKFRARSSGTGVGGVRIRFVGQQAMTSRSGAARICATLTGGTAIARATKTAYHAATASVRARSPVFTG